MVFKKTKIEVMTKTFDKNDFKNYEDYTVDFIRSENQVIMILSFEHESSAINHFKKIKKEMR